MCNESVIILVNPCGSFFVSKCILIIVHIDRQYIRSILSDNECYALK